MARPLRIEYAGAVCHVMARGNQAQKICADDGDRSMWLATLSEAWRRTGWRIHAWALMVIVPAIERIQAASTEHPMHGG